jgi:tetratricopeptide (TPR) repeat protein
MTRNHDIAPLVMGAWLGLGLAGDAVVCRAADVHVNANGSNNLVVGEMLGGTINNIGPTPREIQSIAKAGGGEAVRLLQASMQRVIAQLDSKHREEGFSLGLAQQFLNTVRGKNVALADWSQTFADLTRHYLAIGDQIDATPLSSTPIKELVGRADAARKRGQLAEADALLDKATQLALEETRKIQEQVAGLMVSRANLALTQLDRPKGATLLERAFSQVESAPSPAACAWLIDAGAAWIRAGKSDAGLQALMRAREVAAKRLAAASSDTEWLSVLWISEGDIGVVLQNQGDLPGALKGYQASLAAVQKLAAADPANPQWQGDLSQSEAGIGGILMAQGDLSGALERYKTSLAAIKKLADSDPAKPMWQSDLSFREESIGKVLRAQGDLTGALERYQASLAIRQKLAASDPANTQWQSDLANGEDNIGDALRAQGKVSEALRHYQTSLPIREKLAVSDPANTDWQRALSVTYNNIGSCMVVAYDIPAALNNFQASLAIRQKLTAMDPANKQWQLDLSASEQRVGSAFSLKDDLTSALNSYRHPSRSYRGSSTRIRLTPCGGASWRRERPMSGASCGTRKRFAPPSRATAHPRRSVRSSRIRIRPTQRCFRSWRKARTRLPVS